MLFYIILLALENYLGDSGLNVVKLIFITSFYCKIDLQEITHQAFNKKRLATG